MKRGFLVSFAVFVFGLCVFAQNSLDQMSVNIRMQAHRGQPEWRWTPTINFDVYGGASNSTQFTVEYMLPTGKPFVKIDCSHNGRSDDEWVGVRDCGNNFTAESSTNLTGIFGFQIKMADELKGLNKVLYSGKFTVNKYLYNPAKQPQFARNFYYYLDYDWRLTTAFVGEYKDQYTPKQLEIKLWIKSDTSKPDATAYLIYKGKTVAETTSDGYLSYGTEENPAVEFARLIFRFNTLFAKPDADYSWWRLDQNPGEYEVKVLRKGELARTLKFTIGADGKIAESNIGKEIKEGSNGVIVPVQISGTTDGTLNQTILKSGWWSNPISGFAQ